MSFRLIAVNQLHADVLSSLHRLCFDECWSEKAFQELLSSPAVSGFLCVEPQNDNPLGFILLQGGHGEGEIITLASHPQYRRKGIASLLIEAAYIPYQTLFLEVAEDNPVAIAFYERHGFKTVGQRPNYYLRNTGEKVDARVMKKGAAQD